VAQRRRSNSSTPEPEPVLRVSRSQLDRELGVRLELGQELLDRQVQDSPGLEALRADFYTWDEFNEELLRRRFSSGRVANEYRMLAIGGGSVSPQQELQMLLSDITMQSRRLASVRGRLSLFESEVEEDAVSGSSAEGPQGTRVFVVHGHDGEVKYQVVEFLETTTGQRPVILHEQVDAGRTIIEKFEAHASEAGFAVVLLTADDEGRAKGDTALSPRARQNVVLEFGFFVGKH
jgi:Predicted nucleotide-binding protein containing TIR-like domain